MRTEFQAQLDGLRRHVLELGGLATTAIERVIGALQEDDRDAAAAIVAGDGAIDRRHAAIQRDAITLLARQQPTAGDLRAITAGMAIASELERIADYATSTARLILHEPREPALSPAHELYRMARVARRMVQRSLAAYATRDAPLARRIWHEDAVVNALQQALYRGLLVSMIENPGTLTRATHLLWTVHRLERVADRATNICEQVIFMIDGDWPNFDTLRDQHHSPQPAPLDTED